MSNSADYDDEKIGFRFMKYRRYRNNNFICVAKRYNMNVEQQFVHHNSRRSFFLLKHITKFNQINTK